MAHNDKTKFYYAKIRIHFEKFQVYMVHLISILIFILQKLKVLLTILQQNTN